MISLVAVDPALSSTQDPHTFAPPAVGCVCYSVKTINHT